jgi:hypothetical protein
MAILSGGESLIKYIGEGGMKGTGIPLLIFILALLAVGGLWAVGCWGEYGKSGPLDVVAVILDTDWRSDQTKQEILLAAMEQRVDATEFALRYTNQQPGTLNAISSSWGFIWREKSFKIVETRTYDLADPSCKDGELAALSWSYRVYGEREEFIFEWTWTKESKGEELEKNHGSRQVLVEPNGNNLTVSYTDSLNGESEYVFSGLQAPYGDPLGIVCLNHVYVDQEFSWSHFNMNYSELECFKAVVREVYAHPFGKAWSAKLSVLSPTGNEHNVFLINDPTIVRILQRSMESLRCHIADLLSKRFRSSLRNSPKE